MTAPPLVGCVVWSRLCRLELSVPFIKLVPFIWDTISKCTLKKGVNYDWVGEVSKERHRLLAVYLLNFVVVQLVHTSTVRQYDKKNIKVKINNLYTILSAIFNQCRSITTSVI